MQLTRRHILAAAPALWVTAAFGADPVAAQIHYLSNLVRREAGLLPLAEETRLGRAAQALANAMVTTGQMSHGADGRTLSERAAAVRYPYVRLGENIAWITAHQAADIADRFVALWLQSPPHRRNLLDPGVIDAGVAVARIGQDTAAVQIFGAPR